LPPLFPERGILSLRKQLSRRGSHSRTGITEKQKKRNHKKKSKPHSPASFIPYHIITTEHIPSSSLLRCPSCPAHGNNPRLSKQHNEKRAHPVKLRHLVKSIAEWRHLSKGEGQRKKERFMQTWRTDQYGDYNTAGVLTFT
jgi:hypothetical protein